MSDVTHAEIVTRALEAIRDGRLSLTDFRAIHPELAQELRELVLLEEHLSALPSLEMGEEAAARGRAALVRALRRERLRVVPPLDDGSQALVITRGLEAARDGRLTVDEFRALHPGLAEEFADLLEMERRLSRVATSAPSTGYRLQGRTELVAHLSGQVGPARAGALRLLPRISRVALAAAASVVLLFVTAGSMGLATVEALPGEPLFGLRTGVEEIMVSLAPTQADQAGRIMRLAEARAYDAGRASVAGKTEAARLAAEAWAANLARAEGVLVRATREGDVLATVTQLADAKLRQQELLQRAMAVAPPATARALLEASAQAERVLETARLVAVEQDTDVVVASREACRSLSGPSRVACDTRVQDLVITTRQARLDALAAGDRERLLALVARCATMAGPERSACEVTAARERGRLDERDELRLQQEIGQTLQRRQALRQQLERELRNAIATCDRRSEPQRAACVAQNTDLSKRLGAARDAEMNVRELGYLAAAEARCQAASVTVRAACTVWLARYRTWLQEFIAGEQGWEPTP